MSAPTSPAPTAALKRAQAQEARAAEPKSWGQALQKYHAGRSEPAHPALLHPIVPSKAGQFNATATPVEFNPLRQTYTSPQREAAARESESAAAARARTQAQVRRDHAANEHGYNIVSGARHENTSNAALAAKLRALDESHGTKVRVDPVTGARTISVTLPPSHPPMREYNILSNAPVLEGAAERLAAADARPTPLHSRAQIESREFDIVSNRYAEEHAARSHAEALENERRLRAKYFAQTHYNPLTQRFVHPLEEARYQEARAAASASHGQLALAALPPSLKKSEGLLYDIVAPARIKDSAQLAAYYEAPERAARQSHQTRAVCEAGARAADVAGEDRAARRALGRISTQRYEEQMKRGHHIVTNEPFAQSSGGAASGTTKLHPPNPLCQPAIGWARLQAQAGGRAPAGKQRA